MGGHYRRRGEGWSRQVALVDLSMMENAAIQIRRHAEVLENGLLLAEVEKLELALDRAQGRLNLIALDQFSLPAGGGESTEPPPLPNPERLRWPKLPNKS